MSTLEQIHAHHRDSATLRGLVTVMHDKLQLRARYALLEYEAGMEGRLECSALFRALSDADAAQIERLGATLAHELLENR